MTQTLDAAQPATDAPLHCGDAMVLRETSYRGTPYGVIGESARPSDIELVWACACGFQLAHEEPAYLALALSPYLRKVAAAAADVESTRWHLDQVTEELETAVADAVDSGVAIDAIADAADLEPGETHQLVRGGSDLIDVG